MWYLIWTIVSILAVVIAIVSTARSDKKNTKN